MYFAFRFRKTDSQQQSYSCYRFVVGPNNSPNVRGTIDYNNKTMQAQQETRLIEDNRDLLVRLKLLQSDKNLDLFGMYDLLCLSAKFQNNANKLMEM